MFQSFDVTSKPEQAAPRVTDLRVALDDAGLDAFIIPRSDAHQGEYVAPCDERLAWLTGFTGSAGFAVVTRNRAAMFTDGRYTVQVRNQCDPDVFDYVDWPATRLGDWLLERDAQKIGFDPWLHTEKEIAALRKALEGSGKTAVATSNLIDKIWTTRPVRPENPAMAQPLELTGTSRDEKIELVVEALKDLGAEQLIMTLPDSISWLLNMRGSDIAHNPVVQAFAAVTAAGKVHLFAEPKKFADLPKDPRVILAPRSAFTTHLGQISGPVALDPASAPYALRSLIEDAGGEVIAAPDPCALPKACKTGAEIAGSREAHLRDGAAVVEFLTWLSEQDPSDLTEIDVVKSLEEHRAQTGLLKDISFDTICGSGPHGAIVHYRVDTQSNRRLSEDEILLLDSGGQYVDGTTDITRTIALGHPKAEERAAFTAVLQGMIAISTLNFPRGLSGAHIDALARAPLWRMGRDYDHGTGHGVGAFLSVHEGPQRISRVSDVPLKNGMILSNEPGYYKDGAFGIRIENLIVVQDAPAIEGRDERDMLGFETLTYVPIDRSLINADELAPWERDWMDRYHALVFKKLESRLSPAAQEWLRGATEPL